MSCSFDKILSDLKTLTQRLKSTDETTSKIIKDTSYFYVKLKSMNEIQDKISILSQNGNSCTRTGLSFEGNMENSNLETLRIENFELRELLKEYQTALELIMSRYRSDMNEFMHHQHVSPPSLLATGAAAVTNDDDTHEQGREQREEGQLEQELTLKYVELYKIAIESTAHADSHIDRIETSIEALHAENELIRGLLGLLGAATAVATTTSSSSMDLSLSPWKQQQLQLTGSARDQQQQQQEHRKSSDLLFDSSFSDDDRCSVSSDVSVKTLI